MKKIKKSKKVKKKLLKNAFSMPPQIDLNKVHKPKKKSDPIRLPTTITFNNGNGSLINEQNKIINEPISLSPVLGDGDNESISMKTKIKKKHKFVKVKRKRIKIRNHEKKELSEIIKRLTAQTGVKIFVAIGSEVGKVDVMSTTGFEQFLEKHQDELNKCFE